MFRKPSLQVSPPGDTQDTPTSSSNPARYSVASDPFQKDASWIKRTIGRATSNSQLDSVAAAAAAASDSGHLAIPDGEGIANIALGNGSNASLGSQYTGEYVPPEDQPTAAPRTIRPSNATTTATRDNGHVRTHKDSVASSAFLSVSPAHGPSNAPPTTPLTSLYLVSGLPKSPHTWTLADQDSIAGVHHSEAAVGRWWRAEVLGSSVTPGVGGKKKRRGKGVGDDGSSKKKGGLSKGDLGKMLSKALKLSFTREVEIIASTLQPASSIHTFTFQLPSGNDGGSNSGGNGMMMRTSMLSTTTGFSAGDRSSGTTFPYLDPNFPRPSSTYLGPSNPVAASTETGTPGTTYHGVCLTVWSHADEERSQAIRRTLESAARNGEPSARPGRAHKVSVGSLATETDAGGAEGRGTRRRRKTKGSGVWSGTEHEDSGTDLGDSDLDISGTGGAGPGASTLFLPPNTVFWLPYALTLVSRHPIYDLMRDYLTLSWARFSKDVQSHTLQISKILEHPAPRAGEIVRLDAGIGGESMEVVCRFPGGLDFGRGLVDVNFTMWPLFRCLNLDNILTICELALAPTGRVLFLSRHPAMLGIAVSTVKYLVELRGWSGIALPIVHARDAKIYLEDPGPWIMGLPTETRYITHLSSEICICDLDINYVNCSSPPPGVVSVKQQRDKFRKILMGAFDSYFHPDHSVPSEFKEAFPAGRFRPLCKIQTKKGTSSSAIAESIRSPEWWHQTRVIQAFDAVLADKYKKPSLLKRLMMMGMAKRQAHLTAAEQLIQKSIRKRAAAFVDARDDLETKIGRLSRRLNFLMTESELWREKFIAFEGYAENLSAEAAELRSKIGKEQRESKRLSGLVTITAQEKLQLKAQLSQTEGAHREAMVELQKMKEDMEEMEHERSQMIAEVEAQIERALVSMAFSEGASDDGHSSIFSSRAPSSYGGESTAAPPLSSFGTATTLADEELSGSHPLADESHMTIGPMESVKEVDEGSSPDRTSPDVTAKLYKRFSSTHRDSHMDGLNAVDQGISERSDAVAQKMLQIQQKLDAALAGTRQMRSGSVTSGGGSTTGASTDDTTHGKSYSRTRTARSKPSNISTIVPTRSRSTTSIGGSEDSHTAPVEVNVEGDDTFIAIPKATVHRTPSGASMNITGRRTPVSTRTPTTASTLPSLARTVTTDDSDDYQSAVSAPETSDHDHGVLDRAETLVDISEHQLGDDDDDKYHKSDKIYHLRNNSLSSSKGVQGISEYEAHPSPTLSDHTMASTGTVTSTAKYGRSYRRPQTAPTSRPSK